MKKIIYLLLFFTLSFEQLIAQQAKGNPYDDARALLNDINSIKKGDASTAEELLSIVSYYFDKQVMSPEEAWDLMNSNIFLKPYLPVRATFKLSAEETVSPTTPTGGSSGLFGMNVTNIADGIARFLIERGKQELSMAFFKRFNEDLKTYPELAYLFPQSFHIIQNIEIYNIQSLLQELKDAFCKDLLNMPGNILSLRNIRPLDLTICSGNKRCKTKVDNANKRIEKIKTVFGSRPLVLSLLTMQAVLDGNNII